MLDQALTFVHEEKSDVLHLWGQTLIRPFSIFFGHSYEIIKNANAECKVHALPPMSTIRKTIIFVVALLNCLAFGIQEAVGIILSWGLLGGALLHCSKTHEEDFDLIQKAMKNNTLQPAVIR